MPARITLARKAPTIQRFATSAEVSELRKAPGMRERVYRGLGADRPGRVGSRDGTITNRVVGQPRADRAASALVGMAERARLADGDEVLGAVDDHRPDVGLVAIHMPRLDGLGATGRCEHGPIRRP